MTLPMQLITKPDTKGPFIATHRYKHPFIHQRKRFCVAVQSSMNDFLALIAMSKNLIICLQLCLCKFVCWQNYTETVTAISSVAGVMPSTVGLGQDMRRSNKNLYSPHNSDKINTKLYNKNNKMNLTRT